MRIAVVNRPQVFRIGDPSKSSINLENYVRVLRGMGHDCFFVVPKGSECSPDIPTAFLTESDYTSPSYWRALKIDVAIYITYLMEAETLSAMKQGGAFVISRADNSGDFSPRLFPGWWYDYLDCGMRTPVEKVRMFKHFLACYLFHYKAMDAHKIGSAEVCDRIAVETIGAKKKVCEVFRYYGRGHLADKVLVIPPILSDAILTLPIPEKTVGRIVSIGRWDSKQKNAPLLRDALSIFLARRPDAEAIIIGRGGEETFGSLAGRYRGVRCLGPIARDAVPRYVAESSVYVYSSRWEGFNGAAHEGLALGCTAVGPANIPPVNDFPEHGDYGQAVSPPTPVALAAAIEKEVALWQSGARDAHKIARYWRDYLNPRDALAAMVAPPGGGMPTGAFGYGSDYTQDKLGGLTGRTD